MRIEEASSHQPLRQPSLPSTSRPFAHAARAARAHTPQCGVLAPSAPHCCTRSRSASLLTFAPAPSLLRYGVVYPHVKILAGNPNPN